MKRWKIEIKYDNGLLLYPNWRFYTKWGAERFISKIKSYRAFSLAAPHVINIYKSRR